VVETVQTTTLVRLPEVASRQLPSRGQVAVRGELDGHALDAVLEPDGRGGHWLRVSPALLAATGAAVGDPVSLALQPIREWPEPQVPQDLVAALLAAPSAVQGAWQDITPMARWEWVRWVNATRNPATRQRRVEVSISKLGKGMRRPCCFDLSACTDPDLARSGKLPEPA
jgi:hypothetical protein